MKHLYLCAVIFLITGVATNAQVVRNFTPRFSVDTKGKMVFVSNNIITTKQRSGGSPVNYNTLPPGCPVASQLCKNDGEHNTNIDIDNDPGTFNSSSASITLPDCSNVAFAGLYWGAGIAVNQGTNGPLPMSAGGWNQVKFKIPNGNYQNVTAQRVDTLTEVFHSYQSFADVTHLVRAGGSGFYTVANVKCDTVNTAAQPIVNAFGGWTMVVIYRDSTMPLRNMTIFDGLALVRNTAPHNVQTITVTGFSTPPTGDVSAKMGMVVYDGDRGETDGFEVRRNSDGVFVSQTDVGQGADAVSNAGDAWNSSITDTTTAVTSRIPAHQNTYGYDAHLYKLNNTNKEYFRNNDNTAVFRLRTSSEGYVLGVVTSEIDTYEPEMLMENGITNLNGATASKGDTLIVNANIRNTGTDLAKQVQATYSLPAYLKYVPNSIILNGTPKSDASGDDEADYDAGTRTVKANIGTGSSSATGGDIPGNNAATYTMTYKVTISKDCSDIGTTPLPLILQGKLFYEGLTTGLGDSTGSRTASNNNCVQPVAPDTIFLTTGCAITLPVRLLSFRSVTQSNGTLLTWKVEEHNDGKNYTLQSSFDGTSFSDLYSLNVPLQNGTISYEYLDKNKYGEKTIYYRLKMTSIDGTIEYSHTIVSRFETSSNWSLTPNPVSTVAIFRTNKPVDRLEWYNFSGQLLKTVDKPLNGQRIELSRLASGTYIVKAYQYGEATAIKMIKR